MLASSLLCLPKQKHTSVCENKNDHRFHGGQECMSGWWAQDLGRARLPLLILSVSDGQGGLLRECSHPRGAVVVLPSECEEGWVLLEVF